MHRLLVETEVISEQVPVLPKEALRHLKVLRVRTDEQVELFDGKGSWRCYRMTDTGTLEANSPTISEAKSPSPLTLFACVTKGSRWDWTIEKATELGVTRIVPVISERTIVRIAYSERAAKRERWQRIAEDAARQSDAKWLPEICECVDFAKSLELVGKTACFVGALTKPASPLLAEAVATWLESNTSRLPPAVFVGPEGDFTPSELEKLMKVAIPTSFGSSILRAETAAIFAVSVVKGLSVN